MIEAIPIVGIIFSSVTAVFIVYFVTRARQRRVEAQVEMQNRLIDRFGSAPELISFLQSPAGRQFVAGVQIAPATVARDRIISGFSRAIVLTMLGLAFLALMFWADSDGLAFPAAILLSLGIGYFLATFLAFRLSSKLHLGDIDQTLGTTDTSRS
jgi:hypothetical protein